jgi:methyl-accepting chemotaxis protein
MELDANPLNFLCADPSLKIIYVNPASREALARLQPFLSVPADKLVGESIGVLHPALNSRLRWLADPKHLPHHARIPLGSGTLQLVVSPRYAATGSYLGPLLCWEWVASEPRILGLEHIKATLDPLPLNVLLTDRSFRIVYQNTASFQALRKLEPHLGIRAEQVVGASLELFRVDPERERRILAESQIHSHRVRTCLGPETLDLLITRFRDRKGHLQGQLVYWQTLLPKRDASSTLELLPPTRAEVYMHESPVLHGSSL